MPTPKMGSQPPQRHRGLGLGAVGSCARRGRGPRVYGRAVVDNRTLVLLTVSVVVPEPGNIPTPRCAPPRPSPKYPHTLCPLGFGVAIKPRSNPEPMPPSQGTNPQGDG